ncbi:MAG: 50S ribosomal protein L22 [Planctomycetes bacterium]|nr:50S ribosomal protein L22 [Planctomycetota bacterium]
MEYKATHRYADMTARKIRPFAQLIRGKSLDEALQLLKFAPNRGARLVEKVLLSARGNALDKGARDVEDLIVKESCIDDGPMFKRIMPRARGTAYSILRRMAHVRITLAEEEGSELNTTPAPTGLNPNPPQPALPTAPALQPEPVNPTQP